MKFKLLSFILPFLLLPFTFLLADSIIDSVYSVPQLDGSILYSPDNNPVSMNNFTYCTSVGDLGVPLAPGPEPNSCNRSFLSFELPEIPKDYDIDSVLIRLYQFESFCNGYPPLHIEHIISNRRSGIPRMEYSRWRYGEMSYESYRLWL